MIIKMFEKFHNEFIRKNCEECNDYYGHNKDKYKNICPIYKLLYTAMRGIREFPGEYIDRENNECGKNYDINDDKLQLHHIEKEKKKNGNIMQKKKLFGRIK